MTARDISQAREMDDQIRAALTGGGVFDRDDEYPIRYVVMAETLRVTADGTEQRRVYKVTSPGSTRGGNRELLEAGIDLIERRGGQRGDLTA